MKVPSLIKTAVCSTGMIAVLLTLGCVDSNGPAKPDPAPTDVPRVVFIRDSAGTVIKEGSEYSAADAYGTYFFQLSLNDTLTRTMFFDPAIGKVNPPSIYSTANNQALAIAFTEVGGDQLLDSIIGMEFYFMAASSAQTNFIAFLGQEGGSIRNSAYYVGMGIDKSDSLKYVWSTDAIANQQQKNIAAVQFNKWYKCTVEYNIGDYTATFYLDGARVGGCTMPSASTFGYNMFVVYRDGAGQEGPASYYLNDLTLYERNPKQ